MASPCIDVCRFDEQTGWCFGCGMTRKDKKAWKKDKDARPGIRASLLPRLREMDGLGLTTGEAAKKKKRKQA